MKRYSFGAILALCALAVACALGGCTPAPVQSAGEDEIKGFWIMDGKDQLGFEAVLSIEEENGEKYVEFMIGDSFLEGTWSTDGSKATITFDEDSGGAATAFVSEGKLTMGQADGSKLIFSKGNMDEYFANVDGESGSSDVADGGNVEVAVDENGEELEVVEEDIKDVDPVVVADGDSCTVKVTGKGTDFTGDPGYRLSIKNKTDKVIYLSADKAFDVNGQQVEPGLGETVEANKTIVTFMYFPMEDLDGGLDALKNVTGEIVVGDDSTGAEIETINFKLS